VHVGQHRVEVVQPQQRESLLDTGRTAGQEARLLEHLDEEMTHRRVVFHHEDRSRPAHDLARLQPMCQRLVVGAAPPERLLGRCATRVPHAARSRAGRP
jgi:hypothetical protein